jgi:hypothetical protein
MITDQFTEWTAETGSRFDFAAVCLPAWKTLFLISERMKRIFQSSLVGIQTNLDLKP